MDTETEPAEPSDAEAHDEGHDEANDEDDASDEHAARDVERLGEALAARDRRLAARTAPAAGLTLVEVLYDPLAEG